MWHALVSGIASILNFFYAYTVKLNMPSYGISIILLTVLIKVVLYPLTYKQMHSMKKMQEIQPKIKEIQDKHKKNPEKANQLIMELYKESKVNPMAGCLPLLVQMPILIALFQALRDFTYNEAGRVFLGFDLITHPANMPVAVRFIIPVIVGLTTYLQSRVTTPPSNDNSTSAATQKTMLYMMPVMIGWMSINFPAGLGLYWIVFNILGTLQQMIINRQPELKREEVAGK